LIPPAPAAAPPAPLSRTRYALLAGLLGLLPMLLPISVDGSVPLMPAIAASFSTTTAAAQFGLSALVLGIAVGQLVHGPLSDRFGRKPVILAGVALYAATSAACAASGSIDSLIALRFLQGFLACAGVIVARAVIRDMFDREAGARLFALMMGIHGLMPTVAPGLSGAISQALGWRSVFLTMAGFGALIFVAVLFGLRETNTAPNPAALRPSTIFRNFRAILADRRFRCYAFCACFVYGALMAYFAGAPVGLIQYLGLGPTEFGIAMALPMIAYTATQIGIARVAHGMGMDRLIRSGTLLCAAAGVGMTLFVVAGTINVYTLMGPVVLMLIAIAFITPGTTAGAMSPFAHIAGAASSLLGFIQFLAGAIATAAIGLLNDGTPLPMAAAIGACGCASLAAYWLFVRPLSRSASA
jgi:DHA1 family bicyclomycin/chloramphenicol resistance-like MFS transporter